MRCCAVLLAATACTHHQPARTLLPETPSTKAVVELGNGRQVEVRATPTPDGLRWVAQDTGAPGFGKVIDAADIRGYTTFHHVRGLFEGAAVAGLTGIAIGATVGYASGDDKCASWCIFEFTAREKAGIGALFLGSLGVVLGGALGAVAGSRDFHQLDTAPRLTATVAPGHAGGALSWRF